MARYSSEELTKAAAILENCYDLSTIYRSISKLTLELADKDTAYKREDVLEALMAIAYNTMGIMFQSAEVIERDGRRVFD